MLGLVLLSLSALGQIIGPFIADFNHTHVLNPRWPPHARFHNGQTMSMGVLLGLTSLYYAWRRKSTLDGAKEDLFIAAIAGSLYWISGLSAILYPGSLAVDPEFGRASQLFIFGPLLVASWVGWWIETSGKGKGKGKGN